MKLLGRETETQSLCKGLAPGGTMRSAIILGENGIGKTALLDETASKILEDESFALWLPSRSGHDFSPAGWVSQIARDLRAGSGVPRSAINEFAQSMGSKLAVLPHSIDPAILLPEKHIFSEVAEVFVSGLEKIFSSCKPSPCEALFALDDLDTYSPVLLHWLAHDLNQALRASQSFKKTRFLFTARTLNLKLVEFIESFGIEKIHDFPLKPLSGPLSSQLFKEYSKDKLSANEVLKRTGGNPAKILNLASKRITVEKNKNLKMNDSKHSPSSIFRTLTEEQQLHLLRSVYPDRVNRYSLEFFCSPREAAFCYNWIKQSPKLSTVAPDGDVILDLKLRDEIKKIHAEQNPQEAELWETLSCVLNAFMGIFPNPNDHWIPVNLQLFHCFNRKLCSQLFDEPDYEEIDRFLDEYEDAFTINDKQFKMHDDVKLITSRFTEIGGGQPREGLQEKIQERWELDQKIAEEKRLAMEQEKINLLTEEEDAKQQIKSLDELKEKLISDFRKPKNLQAKREYSVGTSPLLIVLGVVTIGASLFSDSIGSYYAAAGILLTLLGFFWPSVEVKKPAMAGGGANGPKLAIETQQRSLDHRIVGLKNRVGSMSGSIKRISSELDQVNNEVSEPYIIAE
jgi:hypothetical protein